MKSADRHRKLTQCKDQWTRVVSFGCKTQDISKLNRLELISANGRLNGPGSWTRLESELKLSQRKTCMRCMQ